MIPLLIAVLVLLLIALLPLGVLLRYDESGFTLFLKVFLFKFQLFPSKKEKKPKSEQPKRDKPPQADDHPKKGGSLALVKACLPLVEPALQGIRRRLTIRRLTLRVVWASDDPADAAAGYGYASAALGTIWPVLSQSFRIRAHSLDVDVDFDAAAPTVYVFASLTMNVFQLFTLALPLLIKFIKIYRKFRSGVSTDVSVTVTQEATPKIVKKEA